MIAARPATAPLQGSLTPATILVYLALHSIWRQAASGPYTFVYLRLFFLAVLAATLLLNGRVREIGFYFVGKRNPTLGPRRIVFLLSLVAVGRLAMEALDPFRISPTAWIWGDCVIAPINEEILFRGVFVAILLQHLPQRPLAAIGISALIFASAHNLASHGVAFDFRFLLSLFFAGAFFGWVYWQSRSVLLCIACHAFWNLFAFVPLVQHQ